VIPQIKDEKRLIECLKIAKGDAGKRLIPEVLEEAGGVALYRESQPGRLPGASVSGGASLAASTEDIVV
jgi:hypothetical protein